MPTPHNQAGTGEIAKTVLMPGDPLRAEFIAENFLENPRRFNSVRNMLGFTGTYRGMELSVMGSGMGMPSMGIYSYELYNFYGVENIIRIGTAGGIAENVPLKGIVLAEGACTNSSYGDQFALSGKFAPTASFSLLKKAFETAEALGVSPLVGNVLSSDTFYDDRKDALLPWKRMGVLAVEMETAALYYNASRFGKNALSVLTVSDLPLTGETTSSGERETAFTAMMELALETAVSIE